MTQKEGESAPKRLKTSGVPLKSALKNSKSTFTKASVKAVRAKSPVPAVNSDNAKPKTVVSSSARLKDHAPKRTKTSEKGKEKDTTPALPATFKVVVGTYEKLLYGLEGSYYSEDGQPLEAPRLKPIFIFPSHVASVKAVAASPNGGKWLATGSTDEIVKVWDLRRRKEVGGLVQHEGSITHLTFPTRSHLVSCSEDGTICLYRARDWVLLRQLRGHKGRVNCVAVHPSGKLALSVGKDRTLRMWDLMRGKGSASVKLGKEGELVRWSVKGDRFVVQTGSSIDIYTTDMSLLHTITHGSRIQDIRFCQRVTDSNTLGDDENDSELLLVAAEDKKVTIYDSSSKDSTSLPIVGYLVGHLNRVKAIDILSVAIPSSPSKPRTWTRILASVSSDGFIRIFDLGALPTPHSTPNELSGEKGDIPALEAVVEYDTKGSRLTCCTLADGDTSAKVGIGKRKRVEVSSDDDASDGEEQGDEADEVLNDEVLNSDDEDGADT